MKTDSTITRRAFVAGAAGIAISAAGLSMPRPAFGASAGPVTKTYGGIQYGAEVSLTITGGIGLALGTISSAVSVQPKAIGVTANVYDGATGNLIKSQTTYNSSKTSRCQAAVSGNASSKKYQGSAVGLVWYSSAYQKISTGKTPPISRSADMSFSAIDFVNDAGLTCGSLYVAHANGIEAADLVYAEGASGVEGFVYHEDLVNASIASSPDEVDAMAAQGVFAIPLYLEDGVTQVDVFHVEVSLAEQE